MSTYIIVGCCGGCVPGVPEGQPLFSAPWNVEHSMDAVRDINHVELSNAGFPGARSVDRVGELSSMLRLVNSAMSRSTSKAQGKTEGSLVEVWSYSLLAFVHVLYLYIYIYIYIYICFLHVSLFVCMYVGR